DMASTCCLRAGETAKELGTISWSDTHTFVAHADDDIWLLGRSCHHRWIRPKGVIGGGAGQWRKQRQNLRGPAGDMLGRVCGVGASLAGLTPPSELAFRLLLAEGSGRAAHDDSPALWAILESIADEVVQHRFEPAKVGAKIDIWGNVGEPFVLATLCLLQSVK